ncbi:MULTISPECIES: DUF4833 domain-containing protein [Flectobacillus]|uniref:DUF4833 domain-containing protein n=1 Tax=Flectobacillus TaxID=101 RepID=UPI000BA47404|nr:MULTISPECIES: DUF4833 domain-containing protein [Flectobacillus]MDI9871492.1 DUF4833 domain-containing protein [Flectobacillus roseus]NBA76088.1 DUF4833 domain-containing protein [Emticicia sp. ODNR4P]PAC32935.1 DUF4833 domain-containing protein [Flectobacillus sp. BAB-3569]
MQLSKVTQTAIFTFVVSLSLFVNHSESFAQKNKHNTPASVEQFPIPADGPNRLFYIQRSSNINTILYDANVLPNNKLDHKNPVHTYWIRYTEGGKKQELSNIQRTLAYGLHTSALEGEANAYEGHFLAYRKRRFIVKLDSHGEAIALFPINGKMQILKKVFVSVDESGLMPSVNYIELWGKDATTGKDVYEKFKP